MKKAGVSEDIIVFMVEHDYRDVDKVTRLKESGFKDETIMSIIKSELKGDKPSEVSPENISTEKGTGNRDNPKKISFETTAKAKILWYMIYKGKTVLQNSDKLEDVTISLLGGATPAANDKAVRFEWKEKGGLGLLDAFGKKNFKSPFYWDINKDDVLGPGAEGYSYILKGSTAHRGNPASDDSHYWVIYLEPADPRVADYMKKAISAAE
jgi:hypothetical protein